MRLPTGGPGSCCVRVAYGWCSNPTRRWSPLLIYLPSRAQRSAPLRLFVEAAKELAVRAGMRPGAAITRESMPEEFREANSAT